jgi:hypothetical protein
VARAAVLGESKQARRITDVVGAMAVDAADRGLAAAKLGMAARRVLRPGARVASAAEPRDLRRRRMPGKGGVLPAAAKRSGVAAVASGAPDRGECVAAPLPAGDGLRQALGEPAVARDAARTGRGRRLDRRRTAQPQEEETERYPLTPRMIRRPWASSTQTQP